MQTEQLKNDMEMSLAAAQEAAATSPRRGIWPRTTLSYNVLDYTLLYSYSTLLYYIRPSTLYYTILYYNLAY